MVQGRSSTGPGQPNEIRGTHVVYIGTFSLGSTLMYLLSVVEKPEIECCETCKTRMIPDWMSMSNLDILSNSSMSFFEKPILVSVFGTFEWMIFQTSRKWRIFSPENEGMFSKIQCLEVVFPIERVPLFRRYLSSLEVFSRNFWGFRGFGRQASPHGGYSS